MLNNFKFNKSSIATCIFTLSGAFSVNAADIVQEQTIQQETPAPIYSQTAEETISTWDGFYFGAKLGYDFSDTIELKTTGHDVPLLLVFKGDAKGLLGSAFLGFNAEVGDGFVFGIDADVSYSGRKTDLYFEYIKTVDLGNAALSKMGYLKEAESLEDENPNDNKSKAFFSFSDDISATLSARLAYAVTPDFMPYLIGGGALKKATLSRSLIDPKSETQFLFGWSAGAGLDIRLAEHVFVRGEYRYIRIPEKVFNFANDVFGAVDYNVNETLNRASVGIGFKF